MFDQPVAITNQSEYQSKRSSVTATFDLTYPSNNKSNQCDLYVPNNTTEKLPVVIWLHGGGFVGGDSAGAQIAGQYALIQTNFDYAKENEFTQTLAAENLKGYLSYCGPVSMIQTAENEPSSKLMKWFVQSVGWSLVGKKAWQDTPWLCRYRI